MGDTVPGSRGCYISQLFAEPWLWLIVLLPILLCEVIGELVVFRQRLGDRQLFIAKHYASISKACLDSRRTDLSGTNLSECFQTLHFDTNGIILVVDRNGIVLAHPDLSQISWDISSSHLLRQAITTEVGSYNISRLPDGSMSLTAFAVVPGTDWLVLVGPPLREAISIASPSLYSEMLIIFVSFLAVSSLFILFVFKVINPLRRVSLRAQKILGSRVHPTSNETGITEIAELNSALAELELRIQAYQTSNKNYLIKITEIQEAERQTLSQSLHDGTMQGLVAVGQRLQLAQKAVEKSENAAVVSNIVTARTVNQQVMDELRRTIRVLRSAKLESGGLVLFIESALREVEALGVQVHLKVEGETRQLNPEVERTAFKFAQEMILNINKHAQAKTITVTVHFMNAGLRISIEDDGVGFCVIEPIVSYAEHGQYGLASIQERVNAVGGVFTLSSVPSKGTTVSVWLPDLPVSTLSK